jgi:hypothetical protein
MGCNRQNLARSPTTALWMLYNQTQFLSIFEFAHFSVAMVAIVAIMPTKDETKN